MDHPLLEVDGATLIKGGALSAGGTRALHDLHFCVWPGEHLAVLGPNGSGKTSLIGLLTRREWPLVRPDGKPAVRLFGEALGDVFQLRGKMGIVTPEQDRAFIGERCSGRDAVLSGFFAAQGLWRRTVTPDQAAAADEAMARLGVAHLAQRRVDAVSTGELRRLLLARALVHRPPLLLLDEPTSGLDLVSRRDLLGLLRALCPQTTLVLVTHHVEEILPEIERVVLLSRGQVAFDGPKAEALTPERLAAAFGAPVHVEPRGAWFRAEAD